MENSIPNDKTVNSKPKKTFRRIFMFVPAVIGIVFSILAIWFYGFENFGSVDTNDYINAANSFLNGTPYPLQGEHPVFRAPVFPAFIALIWSIFPDSVIAFKIAQALFHGATCLVIFQIIYEILRKNIPAFTGAVICAVNPLLAAQTVDFLTEPLQTFLVAVAFFFLVRILKGKSHLYLNAIILGLIFGLAALCRPTIFPVILGLVPVIFLLFFKDAKLRKTYFTASCLIYLGLFAVILPWTYSNYRRTGEIILIVNGFGYNFWLGNHPDTIRLYEGTYADKEDNQAFADYWTSELPRAKMKELEETDNLSSLPLNKQEQVWRREALKNITSDYFLTARLFWGKVKFYWNPFLNKFVYPYPFVIMVALFICGLYLFSLIGALILWKDDLGRKIVIVLAAQFLFATILHAAIIGNVRYRTPYVDPYLTMLTGIALWWMATKIFPKYDFLKY